MANLSYRVATRRHSSSHPITCSTIARGLYASFVTTLGRSPPADAAGLRRGAAPGSPRGLHAAGAPAVTPPSRTPGRRGGAAAASARDPAPPRSGCPRARRPPRGPRRRARRRAGRPPRRRRRGPRSLSRRASARERDRAARAPCSRRGCRLGCGRPFFPTGGAGARAVGGFVRPDDRRVDRPRLPRDHATRAQGLTHHDVQLGERPLGAHPREARVGRLPRPLPRQERPPPRRERPPRGPRGEDEEDRVEGTAVVVVGAPAPRRGPRGE